MSMTGMDVAAVRDMATKLQQQADEIGHLITTLDGLVNHSQEVWRGKDASDFAGWWHNQHRPALHNAQQAIAGLSQSAKNNASAQEAASGH